MTTDEFQDFLDQISVCFIERDFSAWQRAILLPFTMVTNEGSAVLATVTELERNFHHYLDACQIMSLDKIFRRPISLELCRDGLWLGTYETNLMSRGQRATEPYVSTALLHPLPDGIRMSSILNAIAAITTGPAKGFESTAYSCGMPSMSGTKRTGSSSSYS